MLKLLLGLAGLYLLIMLLVYLAQERLIFPGAGHGRGAPLPVLQGVSVEMRALPGGQRVRMATAAPLGAARGVLLFFLGNFEDLRSGVQWAQALSRFGLRVLVQEYPGYGDSEGAPSVQSFHEAAEDAARVARETAQQAGLPLLVGGTSLGTFSAVHVAAAGGSERLLLLAPPGDLAAAARKVYWYLPVGLLLKHPFSALAEAGSVRCPALVLHGDRDTVVPLELGRKLAEALKCELLVVPGCGHNDLFDAVTGPYAERVRAFLTGG